MHPTELYLIELAQRFSALAIQVANTYDKEQAKLGLNTVLSQERLSSEAGTVESLASLAHLCQLTETHKEAYSRYITTLTAELKVAIERMPVEIQGERNQYLISGIRWQLSAQAGFYANRERWLTAAEGICKLIQSRRSSCIFSEAGVDFADDTDLATFTQLLEVVEETHRVEVAALQERMSRLNKSLSILSAHGPA